MNRRFRPRNPDRRRTFQRDNLKKGVYILPNLFTSASLFAGFYSLVATLNGDFLHAAWAVIVSMFCDGADGRVARMTRTTSRFGIEYDSLADLVAFGVAPGLLVYEWALRPYGKWGWSAAFLYVICGALRLARYNVQIDNIESVTFNGLPIPVSAGMVVSTVLLFYQFGHTGPIQHLAILPVIFLLAILMVSNIKFVSFKEMELRKRKPFTACLGLVLLLVLFVNEPQIVLFTLSALYVLHGPVRTLILWKKKPPAAEPPDPESRDLPERPAERPLPRDAEDAPSR
jgi:CDP-diacylglycerol--serine O-phosphatidyltransferase